MITLPPAAASAPAVPAPSPEAPPVTINVLFLTCIVAPCSARPGLALYGDRPRGKKVGYFTRSRGMRPLRQPARRQPRDSTSIHERRRHRRRVQKRHHFVATRHGVM